MTRKPGSENAAILKTLGADLVQADYDNAQSLELALDGVFGVFAVQNTWEAGVQREEEQGKLFAELAKKKGVFHYVYSSVGSAHRKTGIPHFDNKWRIEETVRSLKFPSWAIMRPVFFMENFLSPPVLSDLMQGKLKMGLRPETSLQMIAVNDIGKFGLMLFEHHEKMNGMEIDIAGDERTMPDAAAIIGRAIGRKIEFVEIPKDEVRKSSEESAIMLEWFESGGYDVDIAGLRKKYGIDFASLDEWSRGIEWAGKRAA
jgi:uncharacterized protein YbjT (DUF2867 family)